MKPNPNLDFYLTKTTIQKYTNRNSFRSKEIDQMKILMKERH
jgi:hypothetical protein